ncbi:MAG: hypothetical protein CSA81_03390 [Acidobacteria bacterium]|nr:MAG: hypothetical protein CSA81_03390 [Acidobacteriota bacterium]
MVDIKRVGAHALFDEEFQSSLFSSWRAGQVSGSAILNHQRIDLLSSDLSKNASLTESWLGHSVTATKLKHPNILAEKTEIVEGSLLAIYPYQESYCLEQLFDKSHSEGIPFQVDHALIIAGKLASALSYASQSNQPHALVLPAFINISAEGDLKIRGFSISHSIREQLAAHMELLSSYKKYFPQGDHIGKGDLDRYAIFSMGAILFQMLTGEDFYSPGKSKIAETRISESMMAATDTPIPDKIVNVLLHALDPNLPNSYKTTHDLNADMEKLLYSGEYSPTTFNLAFFMHSAFRDEVEKRAESISREKKHTFETVSEVVPPVMPKPIQRTASEGSQPNPVPKESSVRMEPEKNNKLGLIFGITSVLLVLVIAALYFLFIRPGREESKRQAQKLALLESQKSAKDESKALREKSKDLEIQRLRKQLRLQMEEMEAENARLDEEMKNAEKIVDERKKMEAERKANQAKMAAMEAELERIQKEREEQRRIEKEKEEARLKAEAEKKALEEAEKVAVSRLTEEKVIPEASTTNAEAATTSASIEAPSSLILPYAKMDNAAQLEKPLNGSNYYTPSRSALSAGILKSGKYYAYIFKVTIDEMGQTVDYSLEQNPLADLENDYGMLKRAISCAKRLKYTPPIKNGLPSKCEKQIVIHFRVL